MNKNSKSSNNVQTEKKDIKKFNRRNFMKLSAGAGTGLVLGSLTNFGTPGKKSVAYARDLFVKELDNSPIEVSADFKRMDQKNICFSRQYWDPEFMKELKAHVGKGKTQDTTGFRQYDKALDSAAWGLERFRTGSCNAGNGDPNIGLFAHEGAIAEQKYQFESPEQASEMVKKAATFLRASMVGIADYDERWTYSKFYGRVSGESTPGEFPFKPKSVIAMAIEMDYETTKCSPSHLAGASTGLGYSDMVEVTHNVATFVRQMGYNAIPAGNDSALSVPIAVQAGLGEAGRLGLLITPRFGPRVRLCKVFTDMPLKADKPISFGVKEFCEVCMKCADNCPSGAISKEKQLDFNDSYNVSTLTGVKKWSADGEKCLAFWREIGASCSNCIASCPYNKLEEWHHDLAKIATVTPGLRNVARSLDELFGYGKVFNEKPMRDFWEK